MATTLQALLQDARQQLSPGDNPRLEAELLLSAAINKKREYLYTWPERVPEPDQVVAFKNLLEKRCQGQPIAYLLGQQEFWSLSLKVNTSVLIPRADTERLVEVVLELFPGEELSLVDMGTGSGAIALALASEKPGWNIVATDKSEAALNCAKSNARNLGLTQVSFILSDWCAALPDDSCQVLISNPPYIDAQDTHLQQGDLRFEPHSALVAEDSGLSDIRVIAEQSRRVLQSRGWLLLEHGYQQARHVQTILADNGYETISTWQDLGGNDRVTAGRLAV